MFTEAVEAGILWERVLREASGTEDEAGLAGALFLQARGDAGRREGGPLFKERLESLLTGPAKWQTGLHFSLELERRE